MKKLNRIVLLLLQDTVKKGTKTVNGQKVETERKVYHKVEFTADTDEVVDSASLSDWLIAKLAEYQMLQKIQGRACFDTSLGIEISITVTDYDGHTMSKSSGIKFSTNAKALTAMFDKYRSALARILNPQATAFTSDVQKRVEMRKSTIYLMDGSLNTLLAPAVPVSTTTVDVEGKVETAKERKARLKAEKKAAAEAAKITGEGVEGTAIVNGVEVPA